MHVLSRLPEASQAQLLRELLPHLPTAERAKAVGLAMQLVEANREPELLPALQASYASLRVAAFGQSQRVKDYRSLAADAAITPEALAAARAAARDRPRDYLKVLLPPALPVFSRHTAPCFQSQQYQPAASPAARLPSPCRLLTVAVSPAPSYTAAAPANGHAR